MKRPALYILAPFCFGIAFSRCVNPPLFPVMLSAVIFSVLSIMFSRKKVLSRAALFLAILLTGSAVYVNSNLLPGDHISRIADDAGSLKVCIRGIISDDPAIKSTIYKSVRTSFTLESREIKVRNRRQKVSGLVKVDIFSKYSLGLVFGDEVLIEGDFSKPHGLRNPGLFNYEEYLGIKKIYCRLTANENSLVEIVRQNSRGWIKSAAYSVRRRAGALIDEYFAAAYSGFLKAIVIGDTTDLKRAIQTDFIKSGTVHVIAVSGLQVGILASVFLFIFAVCRIPKKINLIITTALLVFYSVIAGSNPPIARAVIMFGLCAFGYLIKRDSDALNSLSAAALVILLQNPSVLYDPSFQLSFLSIAGTIIFTPKLNAYFTSRVPEQIYRGRLGKALRYIILGASVSLAAWLGSFPVVASYFNIVSPISIIANLIIVPALFLLMSVSLVFFSAAIASPPAAAVAAGLLRSVLAALFSINSLFANLPFSYFRVCKPSAIFILLFYAIISVMFVPVFLTIGKRTIARRRVVIIILIVMNILVWAGNLNLGGNGTRVSMIDVGQGDSILLEFGGSGNILIDGGTGGNADGFDAGESVVAPFLWNRKISTIDILIVSHFHEDHVGGVLYLLDNFKIGCVVDSGRQPEGGREYAEYIRLLKKKKIRRISVAEGDRIKAFDGAEIFVLNPEKNKFYQDPNDNSLVLKIGRKNISMLFCGDIKDRAMSRLNSYGNFLKADIIKVPHHGGALGNRDVVKNFFEDISPKISLISVGWSNKYGMPSQNTIDMISSLDSDCYTTKDDGAIQLYVDHKFNKIAVGTVKSNWLFHPLP